MREQIRTDYTEDELSNLKNGKCWCGKPRTEFDKGMRVYCCKVHREDWYARTITWSQLRDKYLEKTGKKCAKCGCTPDTMKKRHSKEHRDWLVSIKKNPKAMKVIKEKRIEELKQIEDKYQKIMDDDKLIDWEFGHTRYNLPEGVEEAPEQFGRFDDFSSHFEVDHIKPVAIDGEQWEEKNFQVLCVPCHKEKTKLDMKDIKRVRRKLVKLNDKGEIE